MKTPQCLLCDKNLEILHGSLDMVSGGISIKTCGSYGSSLLDNDTSWGEPYARLWICDDCIKKKLSDNTIWMV